MLGSLVEEVEAGEVAGWIRHHWRIPWREDVGDEQSVVDIRPWHQNRCQYASSAAGSRSDPPQNWDSVGCTSREICDLDCLEVSMAVVVGIGNPLEVVLTSASWPIYRMH